MKNQIDNLVRSILHELVRPTHPVPKLVAFFQSIGADGFSNVIAQRAILSSRAWDMTNFTDVRDCAQLQHDALPTF